MAARSVITIGQFDGVHLGHQALVRRARELADAAGARALAITFAVHPLTVLRPQAVPMSLSTAQEKRQLLLRYGAHEVVMLEPTPQLLGLSPQAFIDDLVKRYAPLAFVEGPDFRFGHDRAGDLDLLETLGRSHDFTVQRMPRLDVTLHDQLCTPVNSSLVRWLLAQGRVADAAVALGRPYALAATVVRGQQRGRTLGVPTVNLDLQELQGRALPAVGVYGGRAKPQAGFGARGEVEGPWFGAAVSVGVNETFAGRVLTLEAHLLDFEGDLYGQTVCLEFHRWLRDQQRFPDVEQLRRQLHRDIDNVRKHCCGPTRVSS